MNNKLKMAFIDVSNFYDWPAGGMLEYELTILKGLVEYFDIELWGVSVNGKKPEPICINGNYFKVNIYANVKTCGRIIPNFWKGFKIFFSKKFKEKKYDIIYGHSGSCMLGSILCTNCKETTYIYHQHGLSYLTNKSLMSLTQKPFYYFSQKLSDIVFLVTDEESSLNHSLKMKNKSKANFIGIGSPIDLGIFNYDKIYQRIENRKNNKMKKLIYIGRISPEKNVVDLVISLKHYIEKTANNSIVLELLGDGPDKEKLKKIICDLNLQKNVVICGNVAHNDIYKYLYDADAFIIASNGEGVSIAVLEAFAAGLPVVCYNVPGLCKQNIDKYTGVIVKEKNPIYFADGIIEVEKNKYNMSYNCINEVKKYDSKEITKKIINSIEELENMKG